ncbi:S-layer homology domain-containing protein [Cohnella suwonensis]|uniref:S-layer homology domain-containing protein n=1 Tax=Cohnella suwonensis TaxID=696072 RepID=A0ABW0M1Y0_9BACL
MRKQANKALMIILTILITVFGTAPIGGIGNGEAYADDIGGFSGGDGSSGNPFLIGTADQLNLIRDRFLDAGLYFELTNHIDMSSYATGAGWVPIGTVGMPFYGHFDGGGYKVIGLTIDKDYALGLFGGIGPGSSVSNIKLENVSIKGLGVIAGLVGDNDGGAIENSCVTGSVSGVDATGGLVGRSMNGGTIKNSCFSGNVVGTATNTGGLAGLIFGGGKIENNDVKGSVNGQLNVGGLIGANDGAEVRGNSVSANVIGTSDYIGGLIGYETSGLIVHSYPSGQVSGKNDVGGLVGYNGNGQISESSASGDVLGGDKSRFVGGLVGYNESGKINGSYASGNVGGSSGDVGGLVGYSNGGEIGDSYASGNVHGEVEIGGLVGRIVNASVSNSYATGEVSGISNLGGLIGYVPMGGPMPVNSFYDMDTTGQSGSNGGTGLATSAMRDQTVYETDSAHAWDFTNTWAIDSLRNGGYPYLLAVQIFLDYDGNGNTGGDVPAESGSSFMPGATVELYAGTSDLEKTGNIFGGWNTQADGLGSNYAPGDSYIITSHTTLFAKWISTSSIASLNSSTGVVSTGGTANESITDIPYGTTIDEFKAALSPEWNATFEIYYADGVTVATSLESGNKVILTSEDGTTAVTYTVAVNAAPLSGEKDIEAFGFAGQTGAATIDPIARTVTIEVSAGADLGNLIASFALSDGAMARVDGILQDSETNFNDFTGPVTYTVEAADGSSQDWTVYVTQGAATPSSDKDFVSFMVDGQTGPETIDTITHTIAIEVEPGTDRSMLMVMFGLSMGATTMIDGMPQNNGMYFADFTNPVTYTVVAEDGSTQDWTVTVTEGSVPVTNIASFSFSGQIGPTGIDGYNRIVTIRVGPDADLSRLTAMFSLSDGAMAEVDNITQTSGTTVNDFTNPVVYTVHGADGSVRDWTVNVTVEIPRKSGTDITAFSINGQIGSAMIDADMRMIAIDVLPGTDLSSVVATFTLSDGATAFADYIPQNSGKDARDFSSPVYYTVLAEDGSAQDWAVIVTEDSGTNIKAFGLADQVGPAIINRYEQTVAVEVTQGTDLSNLVPTFALSLGASAKVGSIGQTSGTTANDFTKPLAYKVVAADGSTQIWIITVTAAVPPLSNANDIISFSLAAQIGSATVDADYHKVEVLVPQDTDLSTLVATIVLSAGASVKVGAIDQASGKTANDFTKPVIYSVTAENGDVQDWTVTVLAIPNNAVTLTSTIGTVSAGGTANETLTNIPSGTTLAAFKAAITPATGATFEVYEGDGTTVATTLASGNKVIVTAQDGTTKVTYIVTLNAAPINNNSGGSVSTSPSDTLASSTDGNLTLPANQAGEVSFDNDTIVVSIPANATDEDLKITIDKVTDSQKLLSNNDVLVSAVYEILKNFPENFTNPITLAFKFDPAQIGSGQTAAVFYYDETKKSWVEVTGGIVNGNQITVNVDHFTKFAVFAVNRSMPEPSTKLSDINGHWAESAINQAVSKGIVTGYPDGTFKPKATVTRAEFAVMLMNALKPQGEGTELKFADTAKIPAWAHKAVAQAVQAGIIKGYDDGTFRPNAEITRPEMATMIAHALGQSIEANTGTGFSDDKDIPSWAKDAVAAMKKLGIIEGKGANEFAPVDKTTRAEAITILMKMQAQLVSQQ